MNKCLLISFLALTSASFSAFSNNNDFYLSIDVLDIQNKSLSVPMTILASEPAGYLSHLDSITYPVKECSSGNGKSTELFHGKEFKRGYLIEYSSGLPEKNFKLTEYLIDDQKYSSYDFKKECFANQVVQLVKVHSFKVNLLKPTSEVLKLDSGGELRLRVDHIKQ